MEMEMLGNPKAKPVKSSSKILKAVLAVFISATLVLGIVVLLAGSIINKMDTSVPPCEDFFQYACGGWLKENPIPEDSSSYGIYPWLRHNVDLKLKAAIEMEDAKPLMKLLKYPSLRWPVLGNSHGSQWAWEEQKFSLVQTLAQLRGQYSGSVLLRMYVSTDDQNSNQYIIKILIPFENRTTEAMYNKYSLSRLQRMVPQFDWLGYIKAVTDTKLYPELKSLNASEHVIVRAPQTIANYLVWSLVYTRMSSLSRRFLYRFQDFSRVTTGTTSLTPRWDKCVNYVENTLAYASGRMFVDQHFQEDKKHMSLRCDVHAVAFPHSPKSLRCDVHAVAFPHSPKSLRCDVHTVAFPHCPKSLRCDVHTVAFPHSPKSLRCDVHTVEFPHCPKSLRCDVHTVAFPHSPKSLRCRKYDKDGNLHQWWTNTSIANFNQKTQCMIDQYNTYHWKEAGLNVKGKRTLGENIADNGGIREAFRAYRKWIDEERSGKDEPLLPGIGLTNNQLFFLSFAHVRCNAYRPEAARDQIQSGAHSPPQFRVIGAMSNFEGFRKAFNCPDRSTMNRGSESCRVWVIGAMSNFEGFRKAFNCPDRSTMNRGSESCRVW
ncbi:UNVERIFIED_CONTAM: hypothetical protein FKN15_024718 [Acipenser sinensis]